MEKKFKLLFVEDEEALGEIVKESLEIRGFDVVYCKNGVEALKEYKSAPFDACILDVMMPLKDGYTLAKEIRVLNPSVPLLFVTAMTQTKDVVKGFECGCNDYIRKPFSMEELIVRLNSLLTAKQGEDNSSFDPNQPLVAAFGSFEYHEQEEVLIYNGMSSKLTPRESRLLKMLLLNKNQLTKREIILDELWGRSTFFNGRSLDVFITKLRKRLSVDDGVELITVRGEGLKLVCPEN